MENPMITPSGLTYDKKIMSGYFLKHGNIDPQTRKELRQEWLRPNNTLKKWMK